jgi:hypothetical protein
MIELLDVHRVTVSDAIAPTSFAAGHIEEAMLGVLLALSQREIESKELGAALVCEVSRIGHPGLNRAPDVSQALTQITHFRSYAYWSNESTGPKNGTFLRLGEVVGTALAGSCAVG